MASRYRMLLHGKRGDPTLDASLGIANDAWTVQVYGENITDTRADRFSINSYYVTEQTENRPRTMGLRFGYKVPGK